MGRSRAGADDDDCPAGFTCGPDGFCYRDLPEDSAVMDASDSAMDTDAGADTAMPVALTFVVVDLFGVAVPDALVAFDHPGTARRVEKMTDADGKVTFEGVDWALGADAAVTVHLADSALHSIVNLDRDAAAALDAGEGTRIVMSVSSSAPETLTVSGTFINYILDTHSFIAAPFGQGVIGYSLGSVDWSIWVRPGAEIGIVGTESLLDRVGPREMTQTFFSMTSLDVGTVDANMTGIEIDLASPDALATADASVALPVTGALAAGEFNVWVNEPGSGQFLGALSSSTPSTAEPGIVDYTVTFRTPAGVSAATSYSLFESLASSTVVLEGFPTLGRHTVDFLAIPTFTVPAIGSPQPLDAPMRVDGAVAGLPLVVAIADVTDTYRAVWTAVDVAGSGALQLPEPPSDVDVRTLTPPGNTYRANPSICEPHPSRSGECRRSAYGIASTDFIVE